MEIYDHNELHTSPPPADNRPRRTVIWIALGVAIAAFVCSIAALILAIVRPQKEEVKTTEQLFAELRPSVVEVYAKGASGTLSGSGVVYKVYNGVTYLITNRHVAAADCTYTVCITEGGGEVEATLAGFDAYHDIALLKVQGVFGVPVRGTEDAVVGQKLLAIGNNLGYGIAALDGIVSRTDRLLKVKSEGKTVPVYAVTCPINAGMSGGGCFNERGELVGISTYQTGSIDEASGSRPVDGTGYVVPYVIVRKLAERIFKQDDGGEPSRPELFCDNVIYGRLQFTSLGFATVRALQGYKLDAVTYGERPSWLNVDLQEGDIIEQFGRLTVTPATEYVAFFAELLAYDREGSGASLTVVLNRDGTRIKAEFSRYRLGENA